MRRWFMMTPHHTPVEPKNDRGVDDVILAHSRAHHAFIIVASKLEEIDMKVSELSSKVDQLIDLAKQQKDKADNPMTTVPADDPEVEKLAQRIDDAIALLSGSKAGTGEPASTSTQPPGQPITFRNPAQDPNAL